MNIFNVGWALTTISSTAGRGPSYLLLKFLPLLIICALFTAGCAAPQNDLTLIALDHQHNFKQTFSHAYSALNDNGDYDILLVHDANADRLDNSPGSLKPAELSPRQLVHIRVYFLPEHGMKMEHEVSTNASIRWYIFGDRPDEAENVLQYSGSGLVLVSESNSVATVTIRGASLKVTGRHGNMTDPLGPSTMDGTIAAHVDRRNVDDLLKEEKSAEAATNGQGVSGAN